MFCSVLFFSRLRSAGWPRYGGTVYFLHFSISILIDSSAESPVQALMLSIQAVRGLPRLRAPGIVPCIISFSRQLPCFLVVWPQHARLLALTASNSSLFTSALLRTHSFVFFAVHETHIVFLGPVFSKEERKSKKEKKRWKKQNEWIEGKEAGREVRLFTSRPI